MIDSIKIGNAATSQLSHQQPQQQQLQPQQQQQFQSQQQQQFQPQQQQQQQQHQFQPQQNLNNLDQQQLVDLIATEISTANNIDKNKVMQAVNDLSESTKAKGGNVIESLQKIAGLVLNDPTGNAANVIINAANQQ